MARILVVEDNDILSNAYRQILENQKHDVQVAYNGKEALEKVAKAEPDVIFLDLLMPVMGGLGFLREYDLAKHPKVKVVILSNLDTDSDIEEAMELGASKYILKAHATPSQLSMLVNKLTAAASATPKN